MLYENTRKWTNLRWRQKVLSCQDGGINDPEERIWICYLQTSETALWRPTDDREPDVFVSQVLAGRLTEQVRELQHLVGPRHGQQAVHLHTRVVIKRNIIRCNI